jgi:hypothetical protein
MSIPDETYWNTSYEYQYHALKEDDAKEKKIDDPFGYFAREIEHCYSGKCQSNSKLNVRDTDINTLLPMFYELSRQSSMINLDYCNPRDTTYKNVLTYLYNASICSYHVLAKKYFRVAQKLFQKIPKGNVNRSLAHIQIRCIDRLLSDSASIIDTIFIRRVIEESQAITAGFNYTSKDISAWYECIGDLFERNGLIDPGYSNYQKAIWYTSKITEERDRVIRLQRIRDKMNMQFNTLPYNVKKAFANSASENIDSLTFETGNIREFKNHTKWLNTYFRRITGRSLGYEIDTFCALVLRGSQSNDYLPMDVFSAIAEQQNIQYKDQYFDLCTKSLFVMTNRMIAAHATRTNYRAVLQNFFAVYVSSDQYDRASLVNDYLRRISHNDFEYYLPNKAMLLLHRQEEDSALTILNKILDSLPAYVHYRWYTQVQADCYALLETVYSNLDNHPQAQLYDSLLRGIEFDAPTILSNVNTENAVFNGERKSDVLEGHINYLQELNAQEALLAQSEMEKTKASDSLRKSEQVIYNINIRDSTNRVRNEKERGIEAANEKTKKIIFYGAGVFILLTGGILFYNYRKSNKIKVEKTELELESLKAGYLGHGIGSSFQYITSKLDKGADTDIQLAITLTKGLSELFVELEENYSEAISLTKEIENQEKYIGVISRGEGNAVHCSNHIDRSIAESISVPRFFLIDIYLNALKHGRLAKKLDGRITSILSGDDIDPCIYYLTVEDNGIGRWEARKYKSEGAISTGLNRVRRRLEIFNLEENGFSIFFDIQKALTDVTNEYGDVCGTRITFKIVRNEKNKRNDRRRP